MSHDTEVVYQRYMGWYDRNPPNLHALPPVPVAKNYVEYMGVAEAAKQVVFANPDNREAKLLHADALELMGMLVTYPGWLNIVTP
jgi:alkyl sulfatase BDS1-like metallo-beta-lactamase superfamily hydrolase